MAVQGLTPSVAAESRGMSFGTEITSSSANTASVLHVPAHTNQTKTDQKDNRKCYFLNRRNRFNLPSPASLGITQSPALRDFT